MRSKTRVRRQGSVTFVNGSAELGHLRIISPLLALERSDADAHDLLDACGRPAATCARQGERLIRQSMWLMGTPSNLLEIVAKDALENQATE